MEWYRGQSVLVTGASGSIGSAFARLLAPVGARLLLTGRRADRLEALAEDCCRAGAEAEVFIQDLGEPAAAAALVDQLARAGHGVDILINNAGFAKMGALVEHPPEDYEELVTVNATHTVSLTRRLLPGMIERGKGGILNVASGAAFLPLPNLAVYAATKVFVKSFSEALHAEVKQHGVHVTCLAPGAVESETFFRRAAMRRPAGGVRPMNADRVARSGLTALARNKRLQAVSPFDKFLTIGPRLAPTRLALFLARHFVDRAR